MKLIKIGSSGNDVKKWQYFLTGLGLFKGNVSGFFDEALDFSTKEFQKAHNLNPDGKVGNFTIGAAMLLGFGVVIDDEQNITNDSYPSKPNFEPIVSNTEKQKILAN